MGGFKQFDPIADTETELKQRRRRAAKRFKQFDPIADTETLFDGMPLDLFIGFKQFDPIADTETGFKREAHRPSLFASNNSIRLRILKPVGLRVAGSSLFASNNSIRLRILKHKDRHD